MFIDIILPSDSGKPRTEDTKCTYFCVLKSQHLDDQSIRRTKRSYNYWYTYSIVHLVVFLATHRSKYFSRSVNRPDHLTSRLQEGFRSLTLLNEFDCIVFENVLTRAVVEGVFRVIVERGATSKK